MPRPDSGIRRRLVKATPVLGGSSSPAREEDIAPSLRPIRWMARSVAAPDPDGVREVLKGSCHARGVDLLSRGARGDAGRVPVRRRPRPQRHAADALA